MFNFKKVAFLLSNLMQWHFYIFKCNAGIQILFGATLHTAQDKKRHAHTVDFVVSVSSEKRGSINL